MKNLFKKRRKQVLPPTSSAVEREQRRKAGLCEVCGKVKTHGRFLGTKQPLTIHGQVYKGFCLTCHSKTVIQCRLAEPCERPSIGHTDQRPLNPRPDYDLSVRRGASTGSGILPILSNGNVGESHSHDPSGRHNASHGPCGGPDHSAGGGRPPSSNADNHKGDGRKKGRSGDHSRHRRKRSGGGRPHNETNNVEGGPDGTGQWEEYFTTANQQNDLRKGVPCMIESDDSATVVSELTIDPFLATQSPGNSMREESLSKINEEEQAEVSEDDEGNEASAGSRDRKVDQDRDHSSSGAGSSHKQSASGSSGNKQTRAGSAASGDSRFESLMRKKIEAEAQRKGSRAASSRKKQSTSDGGASNLARAGSVASSDGKFENLLRKKIEAEDAERGGSSAAPKGGQHDGEKKQSTSNSFVNGHARAGSVSSGDGKFENLLRKKMEAEEAERGGSGAGPRGNRTEGKNFTYRGNVRGDQQAPAAAPGADADCARPGVQAVRKGSLLDSMINKKEANGLARTQSVYVTPPPPRDDDIARSRSLPLGGGSRAVEQLMGQLRAEAERNAELTEAAIPGAQLVDAGDADEYVSVYKRKIAEGGKQGREEDGSNISESEARSQVSGCSRCDELIGFLKVNGASRWAVTMALPKLRDCLPGEHGGLMSADSGEAPGRSETAFPDGVWARVMMGIMSSHASNALVQAEALRTVWCIVALDPRYAADVASGDDMSQVATAMETHANDGTVQEYGCGLLADVAAVEGHARRLLGSQGKFVQRLMAALNFSKGRESIIGNSLRALLRLSLVFPSAKSSFKIFAHMMGSHAEGYPQARDCAANAIESVLDAMGRHLADRSVQILGNRLLWNLVSPNETNIDKMTKHVMAASVACQDSLAFHETAICLLSKISCYRSELIDKELFLPAILNSMSTYPNSSIIALHGCRCIAGVQATSRAQSPTDLMADAVPTIVACMERNQESVCIQSEACMALVATCTNSPKNKERAREAGGVASIMHAYDACGASEGSCIIAKIRACAALTTLALDPIALSAIRDEGIITKFERLLEEEEEMPIELGSSVRRFLTLASDDETRHHNLLFCDGAGEDEVFDCLCANLRSRAMPDIFLGSIEYLRTNAVRALKAFPASADINEYACKLLARAFAMASGNNITKRGGVDLEELEALMSSLVRHECNAEVAAAACSALRNFCIMSPPFDCLNPTGLNGLLSKACDEVSRGLVMHQGNERYLEQAAGALHALCITRDGLALFFESGSTIGLLVGALDRYPKATNLRSHIIAILGSFFSVSNEIKDSISCDLVTSITGFIAAEIENNDEETSTDCVDTAVNIILVISNQGFKEIQLLLNENVADTIGLVVSCMWKWPEESSIQSGCMDILSNLSINNSLWDEVCQRGGMSCMLSALSNLRDDPVLICKAFAAFTNLMLSGADVVEILDAHEPPVPSILVSAMTAHEDELAVQEGGAHVIWATSAKTDSLKEKFVMLGGAEAVARAMTRFTASRQMQLRGFYAMWSLGVPGHLKQRVGLCAIGPVVDGLAAHFSSDERREGRGESAKVCKDALGCLKCLSTSSSNKDLMIRNGAIDMICSCIWIHLEDEVVCGAALATLCNICVDVDTNQVVDITQEDLDTVVAVLRMHRPTKTLQETAIMLLKNLTFSRSNMVILERNPSLIALVQSALSIIGDHHREKADYLLGVL